MTGLYLLALCELLRFLAILFTPSQNHNLFFFPIFFFAILIFFLPNGNPADNYPLGCAAITSIFTVVDNIFLTNHKVELCKQGQKVSILDVPLVTRFWWALDLVTNPRGIGWSYERCRHGTKSVSVRSGSSKRAPFKFVLLRTAQLILWLCVVELLGFLTRTSVYWRKAGPALVESTTNLGWLSGRVAALGIPAFQVAQMSGTHCLLSIIFVLAGADPQDWPPLFGRPWEAYTLRRFWGIVWHQMFGLLCRIYGQLVARKFLRFKQGTVLSSFTQTLVAFVVVGIIHAGGDLLAFRDLTTGHSFKFFIYHAFAMIIEQCIMSMTNILGLKLPWPLSRIFGYLWVSLVILYLMPISVQPLLRAGVGDDLADFSLIGGLMYGKWHPITGS